MQQPIKLKKSQTTDNRKTSKASATQGQDKAKAKVAAGKTAKPPQEKKTEAKEAKKETAPHAKKTKKYLIVIGLYGPGNQHVAISQAMHLAQATGRTLVAPYIQHHFTNRRGGGGGGRGYDSFGDHFRITDGTRMAQVKDLPVPIQPPHLKRIYVAGFNLEWHIKQAARYYGPGIPQVPRVKLERDKVKRCTDTIVAMCFFNNLPVPKTFVYPIAFQPVIEVCARAFVAQHFSGKPFLAVNIRKKSDMESKSPTFEHFYGFTPRVLHASLVKQANASKIPPANVFLAIKPAALAFPDMGVLKDTCYLFDGATVANAHMASLVEQAICALATVFVSSPRSTFSFVIASVRSSQNRRPTISVNKVIGKGMREPL